jgi:hypothetical protein
MGPQAEWGGAAIPAPLPRCVLDTPDAGQAGCGSAAMRCSTGSPSPAGGGPP